MQWSQIQLPPRDGEALVESLTFLTVAQFFWKTVGVVMNVDSGHQSGRDDATKSGDSWAVQG